MKRGLSRCALAISLLLTAILGIGCVNQTALIFPAQRLNRDLPLGGDAYGREIAIRTADGQILSGLYQDAAGSREIILYFHGNAGSLRNWREEIPRLSFLKKNIAILDYRGYGKSSGSVTEAGLYRDAEAFYGWAKENGYHDSDIILYGRSIGTGIASRLLRAHPVKMVVLETPYSSFRSYIYREYWFMLPWFYLDYGFDNCANVKGYRGKILLLHGTEDRLIPHKYARDLSRCNPEAVTLLSIPGGGHNDLSFYPEKRQALAAFLQ